MSAERYSSQATAATIFHCLRPMTAIVHDGPASSY